MVTKRKKNSNYKSGFFNRQIVQRIRNSPVPNIGPQCGIVCHFCVSVCVCGAIRVAVMEVFGCQRQKYN